MLRFKFENKRQTADFDGVAERQRTALEKKLAPALEAIPAFAVL